jgi:hypothetical protein
MLVMLGLHNTPIVAVGKILFNNFCLTGLAKAIGGDTILVLLV